MPRAKPHICHKCGKAYSGWRCPKCYKRKASGRGSGGQGGRRGSRLRFERMLGNSLLPVNPDAAAAPDQIECDVQDENTPTSCGEEFSGSE